MTALRRRDMDRALDLARELDTEIGRIVARTQDPSLARAAALSLRGAAGDLHARMTDFRVVSIPPDHAAGVRSGARRGARRRARSLARWNRSPPGGRVRSRA